MEFKFRSMDRRSFSSTSYFSPPHKFPSPSPNFSYFTQQAIRAGFTSPNGVVSRDAMQRELEKERIRAEIIAEEIFRRRVLEEEVRREMMLERNLGFGFGPPSPMPGPTRFEPRLPLLTNFENRDRFVGGVGPVGVGVLPHREVGCRGLETLPFQRDPVVAATGNGNCSGVTLKEIKGNAAPEVNKDKVIILAKPNANSADLKRKATTLPGAADVELTPAGSKKHKTKDDWSCALCRITATSERGLNEHLQGKKHQARERGLVAQRTGFGVGPLPKKTIANTSKPVKVPGVTNTPSFRKMDGKVEVKSSLVKVDKIPATKKPGVEDTLSQKKEKSVEKKENGGAAMAPKKPTVKPKKKFKFWCEICQAGAHSQKVMNAHKRGKKHLARVGQNGEPTPEKKSAQNYAAVQKKEPDMAAEEIKQETEGIKQETEEKSAQNVTAVEKKEPDVVAEEIKQETVGEQVEIKEVHLDGDLPGIDDKDKVNASAGGDVTIEQDNNQVLASDETNG